MGTHAFTDEPQHCALYRAHFGPNAPPIHGVAEGWNMPASVHRRTLGAGIRFDGVDHYVLTYHLGGGAARRQGLPATAALVGALSLQRPGSGGTFSSNGVVRYAHLYFRQGLLCETADRTSLSAAAEPADFFALRDLCLAREVESYLDRAMDGHDPAPALEMDSRSFLVALALLRSVHARSGSSLAVSAAVDRGDLKAVLNEIEDRLAEPLRLSELARTAGLSPFHFLRVFKSEIGETPARYLLARRIDRAVGMIGRTTLSFAEIAHLTGFSSQSHMARHVKAATGATPGQIRKAKTG